MAQAGEPKRDRLPRYRKCFVCGDESPSQIAVTFYIVDDTVRVDFTATEAQMGFPGIAHGGVLAALLDECMGWAPTLRTGRFCLTAELSVRFVKALPLGVPVTVITRAEAVGRVYTATGEIVDADGTLYARGSGKYLPMSAEHTREVAELLDYDEHTVDASSWLSGEQGH